MLQGPPNLEANETFDIVADNLSMIGWHHDYYKN
jgi:hypothetical protein